MDILTIKNLKELPVVDRQDVGEVLAFDDGGNLVKVESVEYTIEPLYETFNDFTGDGRWWANAAEYGFDGFSFVEINASEYGNNKYTEGYNIGTTEGYNVGRQETIDNASELYVTNNGVYEGDLYKRVEVDVDVETPYNKGYEDGTKSASADAIILDATSNGIYYTKYAEVPEWTEPLTGDGEFYSYITAQENALSTGYKGDTNTVVELWYRHYGNVNNGAILQRYSVTKSFKLMLTEETGSVKIGSKSFDFHLPAHQFNKIRFSTKGIWVNDEQVSEYDVNYDNNDPVWEIGGIGNLAQGDYGMIKFDDNVYIPTVNGFLDTVTNEILPSVNSFSAFKFTFTELIRPVIYDNLIKQVNVNTIIDVAKEKLKFSYSTFEKTPDYLDFSKVVDMSYMFSSNKNLKDLSNIKDWDTSKVTNMNNMFGSTYCPDFSAIKDWDVSNVTNMSYMFTSNGNITDFSFMTNWDTSKVTNMSNMLNVSNATDLPAIDCTSVSVNMYPITSYLTMTKLVNVGGFLNMRSKWDDSYGLSKFPNLTKESCINILNGLFDFTNNSVTPTSNEGKLKVHQNFLDLVGDEINIGISKGWTITA